MPKEDPSFAKYSRCYKSIVIVCELENSDYPDMETFYEANPNLGGPTGTILRPSSVPLKSKNQEINRLQLAVMLPWAIFFESVVKYGVSFSYMFSHSKIKNEMKATRGLLATDHVILNHGQVTWTTPELAPPLLTTTPHQREDVSALDRFNVHRCPTRRVFSGTGLELVTKQATFRYLYNSATAAEIY
ncbi:uncharacterized protein TNCV_2126201 [Trichonephila clavipes]|nr:uncharacterized protein TNCV_2126201 [Trichonephila clavipes]